MGFKRIMSSLEAGREEKETEAAVMSDVRLGERGVRIIRKGAPPGEGGC